MSQAPHEAIISTLRRSTTVLRGADVPFMLGGSIACWARGGPRSQNDLDLMLASEDVERALTALGRAGMRIERPPEHWLAKAFDGEVMVDLIHETLGLGRITPQIISEAERLSVVAIEMPVMSLEDILTGKLLAISEQRLEYGPPLEIARSLRERVDWADVRRRTHDSPHARSFFALLAELDVVPAQRSANGAAQRPRRPTAAGTSRRRRRE